MLATKREVTRVGDWLVRRRGTIAFVTIVMAFVTASLTVFYFVGHNHETTWGDEVSSAEEYLTIEDKTLTNEDLQYIAGLRRLRSVELINCNVAECNLRELKFASRNIWYVDLSGTKGLYDLSFLASTHTRHLALNGCPGIDDISALTWEELYDLELNDTDVTDLSPLAGTNISVLSFAHTNVSDLSPLESLLDDLWEIDGSYTQVSSLDTLAGARMLTRMRFDGCPIKEVKKPFVSSYLGEVGLAHTPVTDLSGLAACTEIETLDLHFADQLTDMSWLNRQCRETLTTLNLGGMSFDAQGLSWVSSCTGLESLTLDGVKLGNLELCRNLKNLEYLSAVDCGLTSISGISGCKNLVTMLFAFNQIQSLDGLRSPSSEWHETILDLSHNNLSSVSDLPKGEYRCILLQGNAEGLGKTLPEKASTYTIVVDWFSGIEDSPLSNIDSVSYMYLLGCPDDQREALEGTFWSWRLHLVREDELLDLIARDELDYSLFVDLSSYVEVMRAKLGLASQDGAAGLGEADGQGESAAENGAADQEGTAGQDGHAESGDVDDQGDAVAESSAGGQEGLAEQEGASEQGESA